MRKIRCLFVKFYCVAMNFHIFCLNYINWIVLINSDSRNCLRDVWIVASAITKLSYLAFNWHSSLDNKFWLCAIYYKMDMYLRNYLIFTFSSWMKRYWFYVKNDFWNFYQIFTFWDPLSQKKRYLRKCLSVCLSVRLSVCL